MAPKTDGIMVNKYKGEYLKDLPIAYKTKAYKR